MISDDSPYHPISELHRLHKNRRDYTNLVRQHRISDGMIKADQLLQGLVTANIV